MTETESIEYKQTWRDEYLKWICGFANAQGGRLYIGMDDAGRVVGVPDARRLLEEIPNKVQAQLGIIVDVNLRTDGDCDREYLEIAVDPYPNPISYKGEYHFRSGSTKQVLRGAALDRFLLMKQGRHWDGVPVPYVSQDDLDPRLLAAFRKKALRSRRLSEDVIKEPDAALIEKLHLTEGSFLKRAAVLLFHPDPEQYVTGAYVKIGYFEEEANLLYQDEIHGDLFTQVDRTMDLLLTKYLKAMISYEGIQRVETYPIPPEALREAVLNAITHKDYGSGIPIQISVFEDRIRIWNNGQLPEGWSINHLTGTHQSQPYNPDIANAFFRAGMIEAWGRGIERIMAACRANKTPIPSFIHEPAGLWVEFPYRLEERSVGTREIGREIDREIDGEITGKKNEDIILDLIEADPSISTRILAERVGISRKGIEWHIRQLKEKGRLRRVGSARGGHWEIIGGENDRRR